MKRVLITGSGSYIGTSLEVWLKQVHFEASYQVDAISMRGEEWKKKDFSGYSTVFHVAGIAHSDIGNITDEEKELYYKVNCDLALETALKAKESGVKQFIYMSSIIVYGEGSSLKIERVIGKDTKPAPSNFYGDSKWKAEQCLEPLNSQDFHIAVLRPPMIYGEGCKGNYQLLKKIASKTKVFPDYPNQRSMLNIDTLCECLRKLIDSEEAGLFFPQDSDYVKTADMVKRLGLEQGRKIYLVKGFNWGIRLLGLMPGRMGRMTNKAFGSLVYEYTDGESFADKKDLSRHD